MKAAPRKSCSGWHSSAGERGGSCAFQAPWGSGQEVGGAGVGIPGGPGSAKDTRLNVGSHDVTSDIEVDADEFALPTGKHSSQWGPQPHPSTPCCRKVGREKSGSIQRGTHKSAWSPSLMEFRCNLSYKFLHVIIFLSLLQRSHFFCTTK